MNRNRIGGKRQVRPTNQLIYSWWKTALAGVTSMGWKVRSLRKGEAIYTTDTGRVGTLVLNEYDTGFWRLSVDYMQLFDGRSRFFEPCHPGNKSWQGEFTCTAGEVEQVCKGLSEWLKAYDAGEKRPLLSGMKPWIGYTWTDTAWKEYDYRNTPEALAEAIAKSDAGFRGIVNSRTIASTLGTDPTRTKARVAAYMQENHGWMQVNPHLWRRVYSDAWILRILKDMGTDGLCDTPGILVKTWHGYDRNELVKLEAYMQDMRERGLVRIEQGLWWRAV